MDRRTFLESMLGATAGMTLPTWLRDLGIDPVEALAPAELVVGPPDDQVTTGPRVGLADVERIRSDTERFARMDQQHGGGHARWLVVSYLDHQVAPMLQGAYTEEVGRELFCAAAVLSRRAGVMALDAGRHGLAQCYYVQALRLAHAAGDRALGAYMLTQMAGQTIHLGHPVKAAELARAAQQGASDAATPTLLARIFAIEARAHARLGDRSACEKALSRSTAAFERAERSRDPRWLDGVNSGDVYLAWEFAKCFRDLHQGPRAVEWASMAVTGGDADQVRRRALSTALLASSYLEQNELERACATGLEAVALAERLKSHLSLDAIRELRGRFTPHVALGVVKEFDDRASALLG